MRGDEAPPSRRNEPTSFATPLPGTLPRMLADDIAVAHTPPGGFGEHFPAPVLAGCTEPLVDGAPDLRGLWKALRAERAGQRVPPDDRILSYMEPRRSTGTGCPASARPLTRQSGTCSSTSVAWRVCFLSSKRVPDEVNPVLI